MKCIFIELEKNMEVNVTETTQYVVYVSSSACLNFVFEKPQVSAEVLVFCKPKKDLDFKISSTHQVEATGCNIEIRGVVEGNYHLSATGSINIHPNARNTESFLRGNILLLGEKSRCDFLPVLDIKNNTVSASHGVAIGRIDEHKLYYLSSRGLTSDDVSSILMDAHFKALQQQIIESKISEKLVDKLL